MKKSTDQYTFERARRLHDKILKLTRNARDSEDDDRIEKEKDKLFNLVKDYSEDAHTLLHLPFHPDLLERLDAYTASISHDSIKEPTKSPDKQFEEAEDFIRNLKVWPEDHESGTEISFQEPGKSPVSYNHKHMNFRNPKDTKYKELVSILHSSTHIYDLGPSKENLIRSKNYDAKRKRLRDINEKLVVFFNKHFPVQLPKNYILYEKCKHEKSGTYRFKFQIVSSSNDQLPFNLKNKKEDVVRFIEENAAKYMELQKIEAKGSELNREHYPFCDGFGQLVDKVLYEKWLSKDELNKLLDINSYLEHTVQP